MLNSSVDPLAANFDRVRSWLVDDFCNACKLGAANELCEGWRVWLRSDLVEDRLSESERVSIIESGRIADTLEGGAGE